jgi:hypothetical protein
LERTRSTDTTTCPEAAVCLDQNVSMPRIHLAVCV